MSDAKVIVRKAEPQDKDFVMDSWVRGQYHGSPYWSQMPKDLFYKYYSGHIRNLLSSAKVEVAVLSDDPTIILGFLVTSGTAIHWAYTKLDYRGQGIQKMLINGREFKSVTSTTLPGASITKKKKLIFNPFPGVI